MTVTIEQLKALEGDLREKIGDYEAKLEMLEQELGTVCGAIQLFERLEKKNATHVNGTGTHKKFHTASDHISAALSQNPEGLTVFALRAKVADHVRPESISAVLDKLKKAGRVDHNYSTGIWKAKP